MLIEIRHRKTNNCLTHLDVESQKMQIIAAESRMLVCQGLKVGEMERCLLVREAKFKLHRMSKSWRSAVQCHAHS